MEILFEARTPLGIKVRITKDYWNYLIEIKGTVHYNHFSYDFFWKLEIRNWEEKILLLC
ncbi:hypothetical protein KKG61_01910 [bacterium]|nr:hypothetical protein [bacterium]MBU1598856.1 hypothetical protein [bacterium]